MTDDAWIEIRRWREQMDARVTKLETDRAVEAERYQNIVKRLDRLDNGVSKILWIIGGAIIAGFVSFMLRGGLNVPGI
ncbi:hypothetical protein AB1P65_09570 [Roseibium alexandrii]|jgi:hypothetical protein